MKTFVMYLRLVYFWYFLSLLLSYFSIFSFLFQIISYFQRVAFANWKSGKSRI